MKYSISYVRFSFKNKYQDHREIEKKREKERIKQIWNAPSFSLSNLNFLSVIANPNGNNSRYYLCIAKKYIAQDFLNRNMKNLLLIREKKIPGL